MRKLDTPPLPVWVGRWELRLVAAGLTRAMRGPAWDQDVGVSRPIYYGPVAWICLRRRTLTARCASGVPDRISNHAWQFAAVSTGCQVVPSGRGWTGHVFAGVQHA